MENNATATAQNPTEASANQEASATLLASAGSEPGKQTPPAAETQPTTTTTEKPKTETTTTEKPATDAGKPAEVVPEKYEFKAPEGTEYAPEVLESFSAAAKKTKLSQEQAQQLIEEMAPALVARQVDQVKAIHDDWRAAASSDAEFGGDKLAENLGVARKALETFGTPALRSLLDETGLGNHPEVIRVLFKVGKAISEDKFVGGHAPAGASDATKVLYDKTQPQK